MLSHIATDLYESYVEEVLKPQLGTKQSAPTSDKEGSQDPKESSEKRIRQAVYDIRYRARRENVPIQSAFGQYMAHSSLSSMERMAVKEKLGLAKASGASVDEEYIDEAPHYNKYNSNTKKYKVRVTDKLSGKTYVRYATREKINKLRSNPNISSVEMTQYGDPYEGEKSKGEQTAKSTSGKGLDPVGKEDKKGDVDNDEIPASRDKNDQYLLNRRKVVSNNIAKQKKVKVSEEFSDWRSDLSEVVDDDIKFQEKNQIKEKKVSNNVVINPELSTEQVQVLESVELSEEYINETVYGAVDYFMAEGLNDEGVEILIDELGLDEFVNFVFELGNEVITEARTLLGKKKNPQKLPKGTAPSQATKAAVAKYGTTRRFKSPGTSGVVKKNRPAAKAVEKAKETQPTKKPVRDAIARGIFRAVDAYKAGMKRHRAAMDAARETGKTVAKAAAVTHEAGRRAGQSQVGQAIKKVGGAVIKAGVEKAKKDIKSLKKEEVEIDEAVYGQTKKQPKVIYGKVSYGKAKSEEPKDTRYTVTQADKTARTKAYREFLKGNPKYKAADHLREKAESEQQQKLFGLALSVKRGQTPRSKVSTEVLKIVNTMSEKQIRKYAKTKHSEVPKKVDEAVSQISGRENNPPAGTTAQQDNIQKQQLANQKRMLDKKRKYEMDILNQQKQGKLPMGRGVVGEENKKLSAIELVKQQLIAKHGPASLMGTPEHEAAKKDAAKKAKNQPKPTQSNRYKDDVYSKDSLGGIRGYRSGD